MGASLQLKDIKLPEPVSFWPPAIGWWFVAGVVLLLLIVSSVWLARRWRYRRVRIQQRQQIAARVRQVTTAEQANALFKRMALLTSASPTIKNAYGEQWFQFLYSTLPAAQHAQLTPAITVLKEHLYRADTLDDQQRQSLQQALMLWWKYAVEPNKRMKS